MFNKHKVFLMVSFVVCAVFMFSLMATVAYSKRFRMDKVPETGKTFGCLLCHVKPRGRLPLNPFGKDYEQIAIPAGETYTKELGELDSDKDGFPNDKEFESKTNPGNPESKPQTE